MAKPSGKKIEFKDIVGNAGVYWWLGTTEAIRFKYDGAPAGLSGIECETLDGTWSIKKIWLSSGYGHFETDEIPLPWPANINTTTIKINGVKIAGSINHPDGVIADPCGKRGECECQNLFAFGHEKNCPWYRKTEK